MTKKRNICIAILLIIVLILSSLAIIERVTANPGAPTQSSQLIWDGTTEKALNATDVVVPPTSFNVTINDAEGDKMNITLLTNESGSWTVVNQTTGIGLDNGTYSFTNVSWVDANGITYYISFNVTDGTGWTNETFKFTTIDNVIITRISQTPPNIRTNTTGSIAIIFNITTDHTAINQSSILIAHTVNHTHDGHNCFNASMRIPASPKQPDKKRACNRNEGLWFEQFNDSGTGEIGDIGEWGVRNETLCEAFTVEASGSNWIRIKWSPKLTCLIPDVWPVDRSAIIEENKTGQTIDIYRKHFAKMEFNMSGTCYWDAGWYTNTTHFVFFNADYTGNPKKKGMRVYFANESYTIGRPRDSEYCELVGEIDKNTAYYCTPKNSSYYIIEFGANETGYVGAVRATDLSYLIFTSDAKQANHYVLYYANDTVTDNTNFNETGMVETTSNNGNTWNGFAGTIDCHIAYGSLDEEDRIEYKVYAQDTSNHSAWSDIYQDLLDITNYPPSPPEIYTPDDGSKYNLYDRINITYGWCGDPNEEPGTSNISLCNETGVFIQKLDETLLDVHDYHTMRTFYYIWDTSGASDGNYTINVTINDSEGLSRSDLSGVFNISQIGEDIIISNIYPVNNSRHVDITNNPPDPNGYVNLSFQLNDTSGGGDMEFYLDAWNGTAYVNRLHLTDQSNGTWHHHENEYPFNETNQTCPWRILAKDHTTGVWTNVTLNFHTDCVPDKPFGPSPANASNVDAGYVELSVNVTHPDGDDGGRINNVTFYEYPSGRIIGYNYTAVGYENGTIVKCPTLFYVPYTGTKYYWFARCRDDEYWGSNSSVWNFETNYTDVQPDNVWYSMGAQIIVSYSADFSNPSPANGSTNQWFHTPISIDVNSTTTKEWVCHFYTNASGSWAEFASDTMTTNGTATVYSPMLDWNTTFYWYVHAVNTTTGKTNDSEIYHYTTLTSEAEPSNVWYSLGAQGHVKYLDTYITSIIPVNESTNIPYDTATGVHLEWQINDSVGDLMNYTVESNATGSWVTVTSDAGVGNGTYTYDYSAMNQSGTTYWWSVNVSDQRDGDTYWNRSIFHFSTTYMPEITLNSPANESAAETPPYTTLNVSISDKDGDLMNITFYTRGGTELGSNTSVGNGSYEQQMYTPYEATRSDWYVVVEDANDASNTSGIWWFETTYTGTEPDTVWYSLGGQILISYSADFNNPSPTNGSIGEWFHTPISIDINSTTTKEWVCHFYTNHTTDGSWIEFASDTMTTNGTATVYSPMLDWNTTFYWYVHAVNTTTGKTNDSEIYHYTTLGSEPEPDKIWHTLGADIYVEPLYTESQPDTLWYTMGAQQQIGLNPDTPTTPYPVNNSEFGTQILNDFSCYVSDPDSAFLDVTFYNASDDVSFGTDASVASGTRASVSAPTGLMSNYSWFEWYVVVNDSTWETTSPTWRYKPGNQPPTLVESPTNKSMMVPVRRKLVGGVYQYFVRLRWNITDPEAEDNMGFALYVDTIAGPGENWVQRWTILEGVSNNTYYHDEVEFSECDQNYSWKLWLSDQHNETTYQFWFETDFFFWADFNWTPADPTADDTIQFTDLSQNATQWNYTFGDYTNSSLQNPTHQFNISNIYNTTLWIYNETCENSDTASKDVYVDRNVSLVMTKKNGGYKNASYNGFGYGMGNTTSASTLADMLEMGNYETLFLYNGSTATWRGYTVSLGGTDFDVTDWTTLTILVGSNHSSRLNISNVVDIHQSISLEIPDYRSTGYTFYTWSSCNTTNASSLADLMGLALGESLYSYNTSSGSWSGYVEGIGGDDFEIRSYDVLCVLVGSEKSFEIE